VARIAFNRPGVVGREAEYLRQTLEGAHLSGDGPFTRRGEEMLQGALGAARVLLTSSCTHALEMAALLLEVGEGDEVILPSFTFVSTANAFALRGARPVFVDIRPDTLNLDESQVEARLGPRTRAIVPVHYGGVGCEMETLAVLAEQAGARIVEDNAHGLFGAYRGRPLGTFGALATQSFHETKNFSCGEGGALIVNDPTLVERAEILREKGTNRSRFFRGQVDKYTWVDLGSSYLMSELQAAYLCAQLEQREAIQARRAAIWARYAADLSDWAAAQGFRMPVTPPHCEHAAHLFYLLAPDLSTRTRFIAHLDAADIAAPFHYQPLHLSDMGRQFGGAPGDCPVTEQVSDQLVRLPFFNGLTDSEIDRVMAVTCEFRT